MNRFPRIAPCQLHRVPPGAHAVNENVGRSSEEKSAVAIQNQYQKWRDQKWSQLQRPRATFAGPGADADGDPARPQVRLRFRRQREGVRIPENTLAQRLGFRKRFGRSEQPDGNVWSTFAQ